jgi:hypothetical protein
VNARIELLIDLARQHPDLSSAQLEQLAELALCARAARAAGVSQEAITVVAIRASEQEKRGR